MISYGFKKELNMPYEEAVGTVTDIQRRSFPSGDQLPGRDKE
jgi:hypothetical protein